MRKLSIAQLKTLIKEVVVRLNKPILIRGRFGIGKSQGVEQTGDELDSPEALQALLGKDCPYTGTLLVDIRLSQYDSVDMRGTPSADKKTGTTIWYPAGTLPFIGNDAFPDDKIIIMFFDEAPDAKTDVFAVMQQLVLNRCIGEHVLKPNVRMLLAGNLLDDQALAKKLPMPLNNRLIHVEAINSLDDFCVYAQSQGVPKVFLSFWNFCADLVNTYDPKKTQAIVATPRTWFTAAELWQDRRLAPEIKEAAMIGAIGEGPAVQFLAHVDVWQSLPNIEKILAHPDSYPVPEELSIRYATAMHVSEKMTLANVDKLHIYLTRFTAEFVVMAWQLATARDATLFDADAYMNYVKKYREVYTSN
jgi:hypothetical protein